jgi:hypothetical protein
MTQLELIVRPHVKKFIQGIYQTKAGCTYVPENSSLYKLIKLAVLEPQKSVNSMGSTPLIINGPFQFVEGMDIKNKLTRLDTDIDRMFKEQLLWTIAIAIASGESAYSTCRDYLYHFKISKNEYDLSVAYRHYQRSKGTTSKL